MRQEPVKARVAELLAVTWSASVIEGFWSCSGAEHRTKVTFPSNVNLAILASEHGAEIVDQLAAAISLFQFNEAINYQPERIEIAEPVRRALPEDLLALWDVVADNVWAQWRWENNLPGWRHPRLSKGEAGRGPDFKVGDSVRTLVMYGGGKDSLLTYQVARAAGSLHATMSGTFSEYGDAGTQVELIQKSIDGLHADAPHVVVNVTDTFWTSDEFARCKPEWVTTRTSAETPLSVLLAIPVALALGCDTVLFGHESAADEPNLTWDVPGEGAVNHQWGKSQEAEELLNSYVKRHFGIGVASGLAGVSEQAIFAALNEFESEVPFTHSCNVAKPWCLKCPKCCYVYLGMAASLRTEVTREVFHGGNPLNDLDNLEHYRQLLGLGDRTPFECVGAVGDSQALLRRGLSLEHLHGSVLDALLSEGALSCALPEMGPSVRKEKLRGPENIQQAIHFVFEG